MKEPDGDLFCAYREGDSKAFDELLSRHARPLLAYLRRMLNDPADAEDIFQETFKRLCENAKSYDKSKAFKPWLYRIASNLAIDLIRKRQRKPEHYSLDADTKEAERMNPHDKIADDVPAPGDALECEERKRQVRAAVAELPPGQRSAMLLAYFHQMPYKEIAISLECSVGTIKTHVSRAMKTLAKRFPDPEELEVKPGDQS